MMKTNFEYIHFVDATPLNTKRTTKLYTCVNTKHNDTLGRVEWDGRWRQYVFLPQGNTVFSVGCLADIQSFIKSLMDARKA